MRYEKDESGSVEDEDWERDGMSEHPCFRPLRAGLLRLLAKEEGSGGGGGEATAPEWMKTMVDVVGNKYSRLEVRQLVGKLVVSVWAQLGAQSRHWHEALLELALATDKGPVEELHSFRLELIVCVLRLGCVGAEARGPRARELMRELVELVARSAGTARDGERRRRDLRLLHLIASTWGSDVICLSAERSVVVAQLETETESRQRGVDGAWGESRVALEMVGVLLDAGIELVPVTQTEQRKRLFGNVVKGLRGKGVRTTRTTAEVLGIAFSHLQNRQGDSDLLAYLVGRTLENLRTAKAELGKFIPTALALVLSSPPDLGFADK